MQLSPSQLHLLAQCAISACYQAGQFIKRNSHKRNITVKHKDTGSSLAAQVVTEVDILCQTVILSVLEPTLTTYDLALLTEESRDDKSRLQKDYFWCIDPLDGTLPFTESTPGYSVSIALVSKSGEPQIGVVYDPSTDTLYHAIKDQGAFRNSTPWVLPTRGNHKRMYLFADRSFLARSQFEKITNHIRQSILSIQYENFELFSQAGAVLNACYVVDKLPACYVKFPKPQEGGGSVWDFAATACIFQELGAHVSTINGDPLPLNDPNSTFMNKCGVIYASDSEIAEKIIQLYANISRWL